MQKFKNYYWHGNVRELRNIIERLVIFSEDGLIQESIFDDYINFKNTNNPEVIETGSSLSEQLRYHEGQIIKKVYEQCNYNKNDSYKARYFKTHIIFKIKPLQYYLISLASNLLYIYKIVNEVLLMEDTIICRCENVTLKTHIRNRRKI